MYLKIDSITSYLNWYQKNHGTLYFLTAFHHATLYKKSIPFDNNHTSLPAIFKTFVKLIFHILPLLDFVFQKSRRIYRKLIAPLHVYLFL
jgi:hypothetical protein